MARSARRERATRLTPRGWGVLAAALVLAVAAYALGSEQLLFAACLLSVLAGFAVLLVRYRSPRLTAARRFSHDVISVGSPVSVSIELANTTTGRSAPAVWRDTLPWWPFATDPVGLPPLASARYSTRRVSTLEYVVHPPVRGMLDIGPLQIERADPFGLAVRKTAIGSSRQLIVAPRVTSLGGTSFSLAGGDGSVRASRRNAAGNNDDLMTREYRSGDALRRVHWRATARHGDLMVRQEEESSFPTARVVLDTRADGYSADAEEFEWALGMVASLGVHLVGEGFLLQLRESAPAQLVAPTEAGGGTGHDIDFLASLARAGVVPEAGAAVSASSETEMRGPLFAVVARPSTDTLRWISAQRERHENGVALVIDEPGSAAAEALGRAGWQCISVRTTDDPADVWSAALDSDGAGPEEHAAARFDTDARDGR
jgi:uncharacterized protein (DUF58 family)